MGTVVEAPEIIVHLGAAPRDKEEAVRVAARLLAEAGCVDAAYAGSMLKREATANTFLGSGVAIPHGALEDKGRVRRDGLAVIQAPSGVDWGAGQRATFIVAIAATGDGHLAILRRLANIIQDEALMARLSVTTDAAEIKAALLVADGAPAPIAPAGDYPETLEWTLDYPAGLHARPAMVWVEKARAAGRPLRVRHGVESADPRHLVALLQLGLKAGDRLVLSTEGEGAVAVLERFRRDIAALSAGEKAQAARAAARPALSAAAGWQAPELAGLTPITGVPASPGLAVGSVRRLDAAEPTVPDEPRPLREGGTMLEDALNKTKNQLKAVVDDATRRLGAADAAIFKAHAALLDDWELLAETARLMVEGHGPAWSWLQAVEKLAGQWAALGNPILAGRAVDLRDVGRRVLANLLPGLSARPRPEAGAGEGPALIVAQDLTPSDTAGLDPAVVAGLATSQGGPTAHTAILARTLGLAAVVAAGEALLAEAQNGQTAIIDGDGGRVWLSPPPEALEAARREMAHRAAERAAQAERRALPARTTDGVAVEVAANINTPDQAPLALEMGAEGVGLMRTEFLFLERGDTPDEDEQYETYRAMARALDGRPLIIRALDIGGDKQVPHLDLPKEDNPFLGVRGARLLMRRPDLFEPQMRALYRAAKDGARLSIMFPMVTAAPEVRALKAACESIRAELGAPAVPLGIMIEVPAAVVMADVLAEVVDFFSIGTNDLTQYTLAMDRQNPELAAEADAFSPAVLRLIRQTVDGAAGRGRMVGVCGGLAGDPLGAALLVGLGVTELSMTPRDIPAVKDMIRGRSRQELANLARRALTLDSAEKVRALAGDLKNQKGGT